MQFTIIRPGGLKTQPATGRGVLTEDSSVCGAIHREDVADLLVNILFSNKTNNKVTLQKWHLSVFMSSAEFSFFVWCSGLLIALALLSPGLDRLEAYVAMLA